MDTFTQGLLGAVTAQLGFRGRIGRDAGWVAAATAIVPDLDFFVVPLLGLTGAEVGDMAMMRCHRGLSHSLLMTPVIAAAAAGIWWWARRRARRSANASGRAGSASTPRPADGPTPFRLLYACCFVAALSHPLLDWCTTYGTQLLAPITNARFAVDAVPIIDIFYTPALILTLLACRLVRRLKPDARRAAMIVAVVGFALSTGYIVTGAAISLRLRAAAAKALNTDRTRAYPLLGTIFLWRVTAEDDEAWCVARHNVLFSGPLEAGRFNRTPKVDNEWVRRARRLEEVRTYEWFTAGQMRADCARLDGRHIVEFHDMRYGRDIDSPESLWPLSVTFDETGRVVDISRRHRHRRADFGQMVKRIWRQTWSP